MALNLLCFCCATVAQNSRKFSGGGRRQKLCLGKMSDGKFAVLHQRNRCVHHCRQLGRSGVTSAPLFHKESSVRHLISYFADSFTVTSCCMSASLSPSKTTRLKLTLAVRFVVVNGCGLVTTKLNVVSALGSRLV